MLKLFEKLGAVLDACIRDLLRPRVDPDLVPSVREIEMLRSLAHAQGLSGLPDGPA